jgi:methylated-DNA-protein-cysteine methyltransferase related protein
MASKKPTPDEAPFAVVQRLVRSIPRGKVATYGQLSRLIGRRLTPVGVGWAIRAAPDGTIPWQRVVNASGGISTDDQHPGLQREMLESEGVRFDGAGRIDLSRFGWDPDAVSARARPARRR